MPAITLIVAVEKLRLASPFRISGFVFEAQDAVVVTLDDGTCRGRGEASGVYYLNDNAPEMVAAIEANRGAIESGIDRAELQKLMPPGGGRSPSGAMAPSAKPPVPKGMCAEHPDKPARAVCAHCGKRVCPYCLDLYDHCSDCRQLPACVRHESMVGDTKCAGCKMAFCKICLDGTEYCDRCRTLRQASGQSVKKANTTGPLTAPKPGATGPKSPTGSLAGARTPAGAASAGTAAPPESLTTATASDAEDPADSGPPA